MNKGADKMLVYLVRECYSDMKRSAPCKILTSVPVKEKPQKFKIAYICGKDVGYVSDILRICILSMQTD